MKSLQQQHWLVPVLRRAGIPGMETGAIPPGTRPAEAWRRACAETGLSPLRLAEHVAAFFRLDVASFDDVRTTAARLVPPRVARRHGVFPLRETDRHLIVATADPTDFAAEQALGFISGRQTVFEVAPPSMIRDAISARYGPAGSAGAVDGAAEATHRPRTNSDDASGGEGVTLDPVVVGAPILVVDDDPEDRLLVRTILQRHGFQVQEARDGAEALERIGAGDAHSLVVLDLEMPQVDGREVLARLRASAATASLPVVVLTGSPDPADEDRLMEGGADDYLRKPLDPPRFGARVRAALRRARMG